MLIAIKEYRAGLDLIRLVAVPNVDTKVLMHVLLWILMTKPLGSSKRFPGTSSGVSKDIGNIKMYS